MPRFIHRRGFLLGAVVFVAGCAKEKATSMLPGVPWPSYRPDPYPEPTIPSAPLSPNRTLASAGGVMSRSAWAGGSPDGRKLNPMLPVRYITIHHDGMSAFTGASEDASAARIELIRKSHRGKGWGDIGYHFVVDRAGRVWEGRPLSYQGAHVSGHNEGNLAVLALGNFEVQSPTEAQVSGVQRQVAALMSRHGVAASRVKTHQEWSPTACPGRNLQSQIVRLRHNGLIA